MVFEITKGAVAICQNCRETIPHTEDRLRCSTPKYKNTSYYFSKSLCIECLDELWKKAHPKVASQLEDNQQLIDLFNGR